MNRLRRYERIGWLTLALGALLLLVYGGWVVRTGGWSALLLTSDQQGRVRFQKKDYKGAAERFQDPLWQATALYRAGDFKKAAGILMGFDTAQAAYNHGNALAMQGLYTDAIARYEQALTLEPDWADARVNLDIARGLAEKLKRHGGEGTGGKLGADDIQISEGKSAPRPGEAETAQTEGGFSDAEMRTLWLRRVQTRPADFLKAKFAYQQSRQKQKGNP